MTTENDNESRLLADGQPVTGGATCVKCGGKGYIIHANYDLRYGDSPSFENCDLCKPPPPTGDDWAEYDMNESEGDDRYAYNRDLAQNYDEKMMLLRLPSDPPTGSEKPDAGDEYNQHLSDEHAEMCGHMSDICEALGKSNQSGEQIVQGVHDIVSDLADANLRTDRAEAACRFLKTSLVIIGIEYHSDYSDAYVAADRKVSALQAVRDFVRDYPEIDAAIKQSTPTTGDPLPGSDGGG